MFGSNQLKYLILPPTHANQNSSSDCVFPARSDLSRHLFMTYCVCLMERCARMEHTGHRVDLITGHWSHETWNYVDWWSHLTSTQVSTINYNIQLLSWDDTRIYQLFKSLRYSLQQISMVGCYNFNPISWAYLFSLTYFPNHFLTLKVEKEARERRKRKEWWKKERHLKA